jgi:hypothetical protein
MNMNDKKAAFFARTMHTPDDPARAELRSALRKLSKTLIPLHRQLIDATKSEFIAQAGAIEGPNHLLRLLTEDPFFSWLEPMTKLIVAIDEMAQTDFQVEDVRAIAERIDSLFSGSGQGAAFNERYAAILQRDTDVAISHGAVRKVLPRMLSSS